MTADDAYRALLSISTPVGERGIGASWARVNPIKESQIRDPGYPSCLGVLRRRGLFTRVDLGGGLFDDYVRLPEVLDELSEQGG